MIFINILFFITLLQNDFANRSCNMMAYPNRSHAIKEGKNTQHHLYSLMTQYLQDNLMKVDSAIPCYNHFEPNPE